MGSASCHSSLQVLPHAEPLSCQGLHVLSASHFTRLSEVLDYLQTQPATDRHPLVLVKPAIVYPLLCLTLKHGSCLSLLVSAAYLN